MSTDDIGSESEFTREELAEWLEAFAHDLRGDGPCEVDAGDINMLVNPTEPVSFGVEIEDDGEIIGDDVERSLELTLEWVPQEDTDEIPLE